MPASVLAVGLDAASAELITSWAAAGELPVFAELERVAVRLSLANSLRTLPGAIWPEITTGVSCGRAPQYYHARQLHTGEARPRPISVEDKDPESYYWSVASRAGKRVAVLDQPQTVAVSNLNGIQLFEWGLHDRNFSVSSVPGSLLHEINRKYGPHPVASCDTHGETTGGYLKLAQDLLIGVSRKTDILLDLIDRDHWDLFTCAYSESHCVGHQFWHFGDATHRLYAPDAPRQLKTAILDIYKRIDQGLGRLIERAGSRATTLVYCSHGMGSYIGGYQLLPEFLRRLGLSSDRGRARTDNLVQRVQHRLHHMPRGWQPLFRSASQWPAVKYVQAGAGVMVAPLESAETKAVALKNNRCGAIRLNLAGREPRGQVSPGSEADGLLERIRSELYALRHADSNECIIEQVLTAEEVFGPEHHPDVPDLMVVFRSDLGPLEACQSENLGTICSPLYHPLTPRTGDHTLSSCLWLFGPGIGSRRQVGPADANVLDIAPTILDLLRVGAPRSMDGQSLMQRL